jgi:HSP20 family molecular chaperone IbpA|eukprot:CAMPEP_0174303306 /NCGR_PEP_ID=MMETSP0809-20121228/60109_1 /TAXON_ID=73025 ORGANISM="Eutreptiella gymnastica-like, Strain CCMP1594" /NCGR_SAMPLE_ID=MMETSP0809 /ASSEMBLY_ACC=CAM_ASM_000658 /LENGTH=275 /DNA_ID=CAMNT_0015409315 /DNA_START=19 /DNA_END=846 /DNA_ORIENTATION=+
MSANDVTLPFKQLQDRYYSLDMPMQQRPPPMCSPSAARAYAKSLGTLFLGIFIGYLMFAGHRRAPTLHWLQSPSVLRLGSRDRSTRLYTSGQTDKFMHLQRRIDQEFQNQLNDVDAGVFDPFRLSMALVERVDAEFDAFLRRLESDDSIEEVAPDHPSMWSLWRTPKVHVEENDEEMVLTCNLRGMDLDHVTVDLKGQQLVISAWNRHDTADTNEKGPVISHSTYFSRTVVVPPGVRPKDVKAAMEGHTLRVVVQKPKDLPEEPETVLIQTELLE